MAPTNVLFNFDCANLAHEANTPGLNTLDFTASSTPVPAIVALAGTIQNDGIVHVNGTGVFVAAAVNVGVTGTITAIADTGSASLPLSVTLCQTNPSTGTCLGPPGGSVTRGSTGVAVQDGGGS